MLLALALLCWHVVMIDQDKSRIGGLLLASAHLTDHYTTGSRYHFFLSFGILELAFNMSNRDCKLMLSTRRLALSVTALYESR